MSPAVLAQWRDEASGLEVFVEDDGRTAYAYLCRDRVARCAVWLYNVAGWSWEGFERGDAYPNAAGLPLPAGLSRPFDASGLTCRWMNSGKEVRAEVALQGFPLGVVSSLQHAGYSPLAIESSGFAQTFRDGGLMLIDLSVTNELNGDSVRVRDDGQVAYAYYLRGGEVRGQVWLYNRVPAPEDDPWEWAEAVAPFLNSARYAIADEALPLRSEDFDFRFLFRDEVWTAAVYVRGKRWAIVGEGTLPGWCALAREDGPLALRL